MSTKRKDIKDNTVPDQEPTPKKPKNFGKLGFLTFRVSVKPYFDNTFDSDKFKMNLRSALLSMNTPDIFVIFAPSYADSPPDRRYVLQPPENRLAQSATFGKHSLLGWSIVNDQQILLYVKSEIYNRVQLLSKNVEVTSQINTEYTDILIKVCEETVIKFIAVNFHYEETNENRKKILERVQEKEIKNGNFDFLFLLGGFEIRPQSESSDGNESGALYGLADLFEPRITTGNPTTSEEENQEAYICGEKSICQKELCLYCWFTWRTKILVYNRLQSRNSELQIKGCRFPAPSSKRKLEAILEGKIVLKVIEMEEKTT